jgi:uncharacterized membrane protein YjgN (DUF898 family)
VPPHSNKAETMSATDLQTDYAGRAGPLFWLSLVTGLGSVLTLGLYRFWMKTRLRRYYWSSIRPGGVGLEYVGTPWEKLLGFLTAVVVMAFYIGIVNLILMFFSFALFQGNVIAYAVSFAGILPILFFAKYRARRYILARTRWRGIRFGMEPGAWGYAWRALTHWAITLLTLGLLWPRMSFWLEKYRTDRTFYGDQRLHQGGRWFMLIRAMINVYIGAGLSLGAVFLAVVFEQPALFLVLVLSLPWLVYGLAYWRAHSFRILANTKELGGAGFRSSPRAGKVLVIYTGGYFLTYLSVLGGMITFVLIAAAVAGFDDLAQVFETVVEENNVTRIPAWAVTAFAISVYFALFLFWAAAAHVFVKMPLARHFSQTLEITNSDTLGSIRQRARDEFAEAEGFADALDVGAAI